jgi:pimeloyl-ACP methyl ester carboxylesterase
LELALTESGVRGGQTVVLVHGFPDTSAVWAPVVRLLQPDLHVVTYDVRGAGQSDEPQGRAAYALSLLVEDLQAIVDAVSPTEPVHLVAHDWGSIQAWEAVSTDRLAGRFASYTSISGPPLDHVALWARSHRRGKASDIRAALRQGMHSWYVAFFHLPLLPRVMARGRTNRRFWAWALHRLEGAEADAGWPAATFGDDFSHGVELYRANVWPKFRHPRAGHTETPVQLIVPEKDRYVTPALLDGLESWASTMWRRDVDAGHWVVRSQPAHVAQWIREVIAFTVDGTESPDLEACRIATPALPSDPTEGRVA